MAIARLVHHMRSKSTPVSIHTYLFLPCTQKLYHRLAATKRSKCPSVYQSVPIPALHPEAVSSLAKRSKCPLYNDQCLFLLCTQKLYLPKVQITVLRYRTPHVMYLQESSRLDKAYLQGPNTVKCRSIPRHIFVNILQV